MIHQGGAETEGRLEGGVKGASKHAEPVSSEVRELRHAGRSTLASIEEALEDIRAGRMVIVVDDEDRENEGDLVMAAELCTPEAVNFMATYGRGLICVALMPERMRELDIPLMVERNTSEHGTPLGVSVDLNATGHTGISAPDRAATIRALCNPRTRPDDLGRPGHIFPLRAQPSGVLRRAGHTEAAVDLARLSGLSGAGVLCEVLNADGSMARLPDLRAFALLHAVNIISIAELIAYRRRTETLLRRAASVSLPTTRGTFQIQAYESIEDGKPYIAFIHGDVASREDVLVRVHSQCLTGDILGSTRCDCGEQLEIALDRIVSEGRGVLLYLAGQEGRGIGLIHKIRAYSLQDQGHDTVDANLQLGFPADLRDYGVGAQVLADLGIASIRLLTNNPHKYAGLEGHGLRIVERVPLETVPRPENLHYLRTKRERLGHHLHHLDGCETVAPT